MIEKIKKQIKIIESASSDAVIDDAFDCIYSIIDDAMESDAYIDLNIVKKDWMTFSHHFWNINGFGFCICKDVNNDNRFAYVDFVDNSRIFNIVKNAVKKESGFDFANQFDICIGQYLFDEDAGLTIGGIDKNMSYMVQRVRNTVSNMDKTEFYDFIKSQMESDWDLDLDDFWNVYSIGWNHINPISLDDYNSLFKSMQFLNFEYCKSEVISNVIDFIDFEYSFAVLSDIANPDAFIVDIPDDWNAIDIFAFADRINKNFALDIDWRQTSNYLWIKLDI
ncbi:MAG: hypothetical protein J6Y78_04245 [Paludibacteraceae bacterium]|nr:hypothetical protein [Paludibacteraceae bacterium]